VSKCNALKGIIDIYLEKYPEGGWKDFSEEDWDVIFTHTSGCLTCLANGKFAERVLGEDNEALKAAIGEQIAARRKKEILGAD